MKNRNSRKNSCTVSLSVLLLGIFLFPISSQPVWATPATITWDAGPQAEWIQPVGRSLYVDGYNSNEYWRSYRQEAKWDRHWEKRQRKEERHYWKARRKYDRRIDKAERKYDRSIYGY